MARTLEPDSLSASIAHSFSGPARGEIARSLPRLTRALRGRSVLAVTILGGLLLAGGLARVHGAQAPEPTETAREPVPVEVATLRSEPVRIWSQFSGRLAAVDAAEIRPQVSGRIVDVHVRDGAIARAGDVLFVIDPRPYEAAVAKAEATLAAARANASFARSDHARASELLRTDAIAPRLHDQLASADRVARASLLAAEAELRQARLDLDHAYVKAPITGRLSRAELTVGNLVEAGPTAPLLTSIVSNDGIYADFDVDEQTYLQTLQGSAAPGAAGSAISALAASAAPVELTLAGEDAPSARGTLLSFDNRIDTRSGTIRARARFANEDGRLVPGMFASVRLGSSGERPALLVPDRAIGTDQSKKFVYVIGPDERVQYREVALGTALGGRHVVRSGVQAGERVIVSGLQHVRPDDRVAARESDALAQGSGE